MEKDELLGKELCNLYAIAKQVNRYFNESDIGCLSENVERMLSKYILFSRNNEVQVSKTLRKLSINPGNTTDSVVHEILENLDEIATQKGCSDEVRELGYTMSLNRLVSYHAANISNLELGLRTL